MKPVNQTDSSKESGNCQQAAVASLFNLKIEQVPNFILFEHQRGWEVLCGFIWGLGYELVEYRTTPELVATKDGHLLASIKSNYGRCFRHYCT
jgi:hypothetical protein